MKLQYFLLISFLCLFHFSPAEAQKATGLKLRGRILHCGDIHETKDDFWIYDNTNAEITIHLKGEGRSPASLSMKKQYRLSKKKLLEQKIRIIQILAP